jgi:hypothetical protein
MKALFWTFVILVYQGVVIVGSTYFRLTGIEFIAACGFFGCVLPLLLVIFLHWYQRKQSIKELREMMKYLGDRE